MNYDGVPGIEREIRYTSDGAEPTGESTLYEKKFSLNVTEKTVMKAAAFCGGHRLGGIAAKGTTPKKQNGNLVFLRKIVRGAADDSYGIEVAKLAGIPDSVIAKAKSYLRELETDRAELRLDEREPDGQVSFEEVGTDRILRSTDINSLTPIEAMNLLFELQRKARG